MGGVGDPTFLSALSYSGTFESLGLNDYGTSSTALPESIVNYSVALRYRDNYAYEGPTTGCKQTLQRHLVDEANWEGSNSKIALSTFVPPDFDVVEAEVE